MHQEHFVSNRWEEAEENAVSLLALQTGRDAQVARLILAAASLCQRDLPEAAPRLALLNKSDIEAARLQWFAAVIDSNRSVWSICIKMQQCCNHSTLRPGCCW